MIYFIFMLTLSLANSDSFIWNKQQTHIQDSKYRTLNDLDKIMGTEGKISYYPISEDGKIVYRCVLSEDKTPDGRRILCADGEISEIEEFISNIEAPRTIMIGMLLIEGTGVANCFEDDLDTVLDVEASAEDSIFTCLQLFF